MPVMLSVFIDTDDDAAIEFEGKSYCFYGDDLRISRTLNTPEDCYAFLRNEIKIKPGMKVSECLHRWIEEFITCHKAGEDWQGIHGNQTVEIWIDESLPSKPKGTMDQIGDTIQSVLDRTCDSWTPAAAAASATELSDAFRNCKAAMVFADICDAFCDDSDAMIEYFRACNAIEEAHLALRKCANAVRKGN